MNTNKLSLPRNAAASMYADDDSLGNNQQITKDQPAKAGAPGPRFSRATKRYAVIWRKESAAKEETTAEGGR